jgi:hypothetical protein
LHLIVVAALYVQFCTTVALDQPVPLAGEEGQAVLLNDPVHPDHAA